MYDFPNTSEKKEPPPDDINHSFDSTEEKSLCSSDGGPTRNGVAQKAKGHPAISSQRQHAFLSRERDGSENPSTQAHKRIDTETHTENAALTASDIRIAAR